MSERVEQILSNYAGENPGVIGNLRRLMNTGRLAGTGKIVILPVDQGFEHGPARSFAPNPPGYDPAYHPALAVESGCNGYAAPLGFIESIAHRYAGELPLILKVNNSDSLGGPDTPCSALTSAVDDAVRLGCSAIGYTIYPGSGLRNQMYQDLRDLISEARAAGLPSIVWSYPRGNMSKEGETAIDVAAYAAQIACQLGAHVVKVKPPTEVVYQDAAKKSYENIPIGTLAERVQHVVQSAFGGKRIVIFSGGAAKGTDAVLEEVGQIAKGGGYGSIVGRNAFQRSEKDAVKLLHDIMDLYAAQA
ncbi:MAG: class I fructose-bisphosphate aldolase [Deltaproteobacteria bacterium]|nr:class I fructose-bisphosphate aldolase [Deltaproteobacteria bacterium]NND30868.1 class I fructose-bisphosphate aldolase [Myxococcales bacterium]MBT8467001.1 class I fructose-bisphosphate aldolase [Deltaproteobacteria bacterium]MBT8483202.1 class I fructose-bisphosphate aldolase [Deltaproteobacteria bacterium]NNK07274.1 class I fructose-bisphosphate aldolase [Myxococcales bacterium]